MKQDAMALMTMMYHLAETPSYMVPRSRRHRAEVALPKCALPGCNNLTEKAYCCREHCFEHRAMKRGSK
jgi:hypothetical protein